MRQLAPFDPLRVLRTLESHRVRYIVIGAFAGRLIGSPTVTRDVDLCYARDPENLEALAAALRELGAGLRSDEDGADLASFRLDARTLRAGDHVTLQTV